MTIIQSVITVYLLIGLILAITGKVTCKGRALWLHYTLMYLFIIAFWPVVLIFSKKSCEVARQLKGLNTLDCSDIEVKYVDCDGTALRRNNNTFNTFQYGSGE